MGVGMTNRLQILGDSSDYQGTFGVPYTRMVTGSNPVAPTQWDSRQFSFQVGRESQHSDDFPLGFLEAFRETVFNQACLSEKISVSATQFRIDSYNNTQTFTDSGR